MKTLHHAFHSLPVLAVMVVFVWLISGKWPKKFALTWALHILIDIPTHSRKQWGRNSYGLFQRFRLMGFRGLK